MRQKGVVCDFSLDKLSVADVENGTEDLIQRIKTEYDKVASLKQEDVTFENCIQVNLMTTVGIPIKMLDPNTKLVWLANCPNMSDH